MAYLTALVDPKLFRPEPGETTAEATSEISLEQMPAGESSNLASLIKTGDG